jgi:DNA invertase Pin-like site-specific DNA recombinase
MNSVARAGKRDSSALVIALIYTRVSSDEQAREGVSLDAQLSECRRYAARNRWVLGEEYQDVMAGTRDDRPRYQDLLVDVRRLRGERASVVVVVAALDRFGRKLLERVRCREELKQLGVPVHSVREGGEVSDLVANILASVAQEEVRRLGERIRASNQLIRDRGWYVVSRPAWGYAWRKATDEERAAGAPRKILEVDPVTAPYVREAYDRLARGDSMRSITRWLASLPDEARGGLTMGFAVVRRILTKYVYISRFGYKQAGIIDVDEVLRLPTQRWPAIIDDETWARALRQLALHRRVPKQASKRYLMSGMLRCSACGSRMSGWSSGRRPVYRCNPAGFEWDVVTPKRCSVTAPMDVVDPFVLAQMTALLEVVASHDAKMRAALRREWEHLRQPVKAGDAQRRAQHLEQVVERAKQRMTRAAEMFVDGNLDRTGYDGLCQKARADIEGADAELARLGEINADPTLPPLDEVLKDAGGWATPLRGADVPAQREVAATLIDHLEPRRVGYGRYEVSIVWTPLGEALEKMAAAMEATSAA